jgi:hypothetical protein
MLISNINMVFAGKSDEQTETVYSHKYSFFNASVSLANGARAYVSVTNEDGTGGVAAGYMGGNAKMYFSNGMISKSTGMKYTQKYRVGEVWYTDFSTLPGNYYAKSEVEFYNGNGYDRFDVKKSPIATYPSSRSSSFETDNLEISAYKVNENGETYGSELYAEVCGKSPDLIAALGADGTIGYVRNSDLNPEPKTIEEALALNDITEIPLYSSDGDTIIGVFKFGGESHPIE